MYELKKTLILENVSRIECGVFFSNNVDKITLYKKSTIDLVIKKRQF